MRLLLCFAAGSLLLVGTASAAVSDGSVQALPGNPLPDHPFRKNFRQHPFKAKDVAGKTLDIPAHLVDVFVGNAGDWDSPNAESVQPFPMTIPTTEQNKIQLFYNGGAYGNSPGWMIVPRKWILWDAGEGSLGKHFDFAAPSGPANGWMSVSINYGGNTDYLLDDVGGLLPSANKVLAKLYQRREFSETVSPDAEIVPQPISITHPNPCAALFKYEKSGTVIHGAVLLENDEGLYDTTLYITDSGTDEATASYIAKTFLENEIQEGLRCPVRSRADDGPWLPPQSAATDGLRP